MAISDAGIKMLAKYRGKTGVTSVILAQQQIQQVRQPYKGRDPEAICQRKLSWTTG